MSQCGDCVHNQKPPHAWGAPVLTRTEQDVLLPSVGTRPKAETRGRGRIKSTGCTGTGEEIANDV